MPRFLRLLNFAVLAFTVFALAPQTQASSLNQCEALFRSVKNVGAKTELRSHLESIEARLISQGLSLNGFNLKIRHGDRARISITMGETQIAFGFLRPQAQGVHVGRVSIEMIRVNSEYAQRGIGTIAYLLLAREAVRQGYLLESSWDLTDESRSAWKSFVKRGWAKKIDYLFNEFDTEFINAPDTIGAIDEVASRFGGTN
ncbi:hypothetical protein BH10BDE1_BH10BDE1_34790 [soil metagenome]